MELFKRPGLNGWVVTVKGTDGREIAITEKEWERLKNAMGRFLKMPNTSMLKLS